MNIKNFRIISILEGISYLLLFGVTMPLKYMANMPEPNQVIGMIHGILFVIYVIMAVVLQRKYGWSYTTLMIMLFCSILPFGTFWMERKYLRTA